MIEAKKTEISNIKHKEEKKVPKNEVMPAYNRN